MGLNLAGTVRQLSGSGISCNIVILLIVWMRLADWLASILTSK
jgi:hypothetical protein